MKTPKLLRKLHSLVSNNKTKPYSRKPSVQKSKWLFHSGNNDIKLTKADNLQEILQKLP